MPDAVKKVELSWVSLNEATKLLGLNREAVLRLGVEGKLTITRMGRWTIVSRGSIDAYAASLAE